MSDEIKFSIVIPVYNSGIALTKCVESIKNQPYNDFELILIDDGSTDETTTEILYGYEKERGRVKVFHKLNGGSLDARRYGVIKAVGDFIMFGDGDDYFDTEYMNVVHQAIEKPADLYLLNNYINYCGTKNFHKEKDNLITGYVSKEWFLRQLLRMKTGAVWDKIYRKNLFGFNADIIPENITYGDDIYINNQYIPSVKSIYVLDRAIYYHYVDSGTSVCGKKASLNRLNDISIVFDSLDSVKSLEGIDEKDCEAFRDFFYGYFVRTIASLVKQNIDRKQINENILEENIINNIILHDAVSLKGVVYRLILKYKLYKVAALLCG